MPRRTRWCGSSVGDVLAVEEDAARWSACSMPVSRLIERRLAGAVRPDQRVARALLDLQRNVVRRDDAAEILAEADRLEREVAIGLSAPAVRSRRAKSAPMRSPALAERRAAARSSRHALAADQHDHDEHQAEPELPVLRRELASQSCISLNSDRADETAVQIAGAADDQHQQQVGRAVEREHVERREGRGLRQQRAGDAGIDAAAIV